MPKLDITIFNPTVSDKDKRNRENGLYKLKECVTKNVNVYGVASYGGGFLVDAKRWVVSHETFAPKGSPLEKFLNSDTIKKQLEEKTAETMIWIQEKIDALEDGDDINDDISDEVRNLEKLQ